MTATITLAQFEQIDGLLNECLRRPALDDIIHLGREAVSEQFFRPEWKLLDALVDTFGLFPERNYASTIDWAADVVTRGLTSASFVEAA